MSKYIFHEGRLPPNFKPVFERFLYNQERHLYSQSKKGWTGFSLIDESAKTILAQLHFYEEKDGAISPCRAPFGSIEFSDHLSAETLHKFLSDIEKRLKKKKVKKIKIKDAPHAYRPGQGALLTTLLKDLDYQVVQSEVNSSLTVDELSFASKISKDELYHLKRCHREFLSFHELGMIKLVEVYRFIERCRHERGMSLSMTMDEIIMTVRSCPTDFHLFGVYQDDEMIAASISLKVSPRILYDFYYGNTKASNNLSPIVFLLEGQYNFCIKKGYRVLDLGTSMLNDKINLSLLNFKTQVGGVPSLKLTFEKRIQ